MIEVTTLVWENGYILTISKEMWRGQGLQDQLRHREVQKSVGTISYEGVKKKRGAHIQVRRSERIAGYPLCPISVVLLEMLQEGDQLHEWNTEAPLGIQVKLNME